MVAYIEAEQLLYRLPENWVDCTGLQRVLHLVTGARAQVM